MRNKAVKIAKEYNPSIFDRIEKLYKDPDIVYKEIAGIVVQDLQKVIHNVNTELYGEASTKGEFRLCFMSKTSGRLDRIEYSLTYKISPSYKLADVGDIIFNEKLSSTITKALKEAFDFPLGKIQYEINKYNFKVAYDVIRLHIVFYQEKIEVPENREYF